MINPTITCDGCGERIIRWISAQYMLELRAVSPPSDGAAVCDLMLPPDITRPHHFCGLRCLDQWRESAKS